METLTRYSVIAEKNPREIVLLRGTGCRWRRCTFCDYHLDCSPDVAENIAVNAAVLSKVTGRYARLEIINSGSFVDLDAQTIAEILRVCGERGITAVHFECHFMHRKEIPALREYFSGITLKIKTGVETFDYAMRENILKKGIGVHEPAQIAEGFDECCLLFGLTGQTEDSMRRDIETGLAHFERVCVNLMTENTTEIRPDASVLAVFMDTLYPVYRDNPRVDVLTHNTDFGVGSTEAGEPHA